MKKHQGFVLLIVLIFMQIYALLGITALEQVFLSEKLTADYKTRRFLLNEAEHLLRWLEGNLNEVSPLCLIPGLSVATLSSRPLSWWSAFSCAGPGYLFRSYYIIEALGEDPCAHLSSGIQVQVAYYRITVLLVNEHDETMKVMLQSTVVKEAQTLEHCGGQSHSVDLGPQSWRELII